MNQEIDQLEKEIYELKGKLAEAQGRYPSEQIVDYTFQTPDGPVKLSELFGDKQDLILIHNMGKGCTYCTLRADGFVGLLPHLENRAAFVVVSPDDPNTQKAFAESRGWTFRMASAQGSNFTMDMGFKSNGGQMPGASAFHKDPEGNLTRTGKTFFGPGDDFCAVWPFFKMLKSGVNGWEPKFTY